jgi:L-ascorbate metabolism protein UlaG (beta-lactamase superfamily)
MKFTYYGHSTFAVLTGGKRLLFDPFISGNELAKDINIEEIEADYIFISHGHYDHMLDAVNIANRTAAMVVGNWEIYDYFNKQGVKHIHPLNPGGHVAFEFGTVKCVTAVHSSSFPDGSYAGVASGFVLKTDEGNFYYSGDTALTLDMTMVVKWADLDYAVFPIGDTLTMGVDDAIEAAHYVNVKHVVGVHYDTFEVIKIEKPNAIHEFEVRGLTLHLPKIGETIDL